MHSILRTARQISVKLPTRLTSTIHSHAQTHDTPQWTDMGISSTLKRIQKAFTDNPTIDWNDNEEFFRYTRGRFISNEAWEMQQRHVNFDMNALAELAAKAAGSQKCVTVKKYPDGMFNKVFLMTMEDGVEVVAKVPNPNAGPAHLTIASEVATMTFARENLQTPVPKVLDWCSSAELTSVGVEYIIMEKVEGVPLENLWSSMEVEDQISIIQTLAGFHKSWMSASFNQFGSLYFAKDISRGGQGISYTKRDGTEVLDSRYAVGPTVGRSSFDDGRSEIEFDQGPWATIGDYYYAIEKREGTCVKLMNKLPKSPLTLSGPYIPTRERKLVALDTYSKLVKYLVPTDDSINTSNIWHDDLHGENIIVNPLKPTEILGIIDWQSVALTPLFENAQLPRFLAYSGPRLTGLEAPEYPDIKGMEASEAEAADALWNQMTLAAYYRGFTQQNNPILYRAMEFHETLPFSLLSYASCMLVDGEAAYRYLATTELENEWASLPAVKALGNPPFPFTFSAEETQEIENDMKNMARGVQEMADIKEAMGKLWPDKGVVPHCDYEDAKAALRQAKETALKEFATTEDERRALVEGWNFDD